MSSDDAPRDVDRELSCKFEVHNTMEMPAEHAQHFASILRWCHARGTLDSAGLAATLDALDQFVDPVLSSALELAYSGDDSSSSAASMPDDAGSSESATAPPRRAVLQRGTSLTVLQARAMHPADRLELLAATITHPVRGVPVGRKKRAFRTYQRVATGKAVIRWIIEAGFAGDEEEALALGGSLVRHGYMRKATAGHHFHNDSSLYTFTSPKKEVTLALREPGAGCTPVQASIMRLCYSVHDDDVVAWMRRATPEDLFVCHPVVIMWTARHASLHDEVLPIGQALRDKDPSLDSAMDFFVMSNLDTLRREALEDMGEENFNARVDEARQDTPDAKAMSELMEQPSGSAMIDAIRKYERDGTRMLHPFAGRSGTLRLNKAFASSARPAWCSVLDERGVPIGPDVIAKVGDDLRKDLAVQTFFRACEAVWASADVSWALGAPPTVATMRVLPTSDHAGYLEFVRGKTVKEVAANKEWGGVNLHKFAPSAVGSLCAGFVLGVRDRHSDNWMLVGDPQEDPRLLQIDFGYLLLEAPGGLAMDTPRLTLQSELVKLLSDAPGHKAGVSLMHDLRSDLIQAYFLLRDHHPALVSFASAALAGVYPHERVESFMWGRHSFRSGMPRDSVLAWFGEKVNTQLSSGFVMRRSAKQALVNAYYAVRGGI